MLFPCVTIAENPRYGREALSCHPGFPRCRGEPCPDSITGDTSGNAGLISPFPLFRRCVLPALPSLFHPVDFLFLPTLWLLFDTCFPKTGKTVGAQAYQGLSRFLQMGADFA